MQEAENIFSQDFFLKHLSTINNIRFTGREIDVISCILSGRKTSKIAILLSIESTRTVEKHISNIMFKIKCNTREGIIDFIEKSDTLPFLRKHYALLQIEGIFEKNLKAILKLQQEKGEKLLPCFLMQIGQKDSFSSHLITHLKLAGVALSTATRSQKGDCGIFVFPNMLVEEDILSLLEKLQRKTNNILFLLRNRKNNKEIPQELRVHNVVDFAKENYYFSFFLILKKLFPNLNLENIITDFKDNYQKIHNEPKSLKSASNEDVPTNRSVDTKSYLLISFLIVGLIIGGLLAIHWSHSYKVASFKSDLIIPTKAVCLDRPELIDQIKNKLKEQDGIQTVALVGPGGAGKTTLARQYALTQKASSIWEINAETRESLNASFEQLAQVLARAESDQRALRGLREIKDLTAKEDRIIQFVKERLKSTINWILIYDNVETFVDIHKHFPHDPNTWGLGKVILTTRDGNIAHNKYISYVLPVGELSSHQKLNLFMQIMTNKNQSSFSDAQIREAKNFVENIPPFPLDVSLAAYYIKVTSTPYVTYLENLLRPTKDFSSMQEDILHETGEYTQTRYNIITLSLQNILDEHKDFEDVLLLISLLDSQKIPGDLLSDLKNENVVNDFIFKLKKYSLVTSDSSSSFLLSAPISMHRSTQNISLAYLTEKLGLEKNKELIKYISKKLVNYIDGAIKEIDLVKMNSFIKHCEAFLKHKKLLPIDTRRIIQGALGVIYYFYGDCIKAKKYLEESLLDSNKLHEIEPTRSAMFIGFLGNVFRDLGDYGKAKILTEKSLSIYKKQHPKESLMHAYFLVYLGILERFLGNYRVAQNLFQEGLKIHKENFPENKHYNAWASGQLGILDKESGYYERAKSTLEMSLATFKEERGDNHFDVGWSFLDHLGVVYTKLGNYEKAKGAFEQSFKINALTLPDQVGSSWILAHCESLHTSKYDEKINILFDQLLRIYNKHFHDNYIYIAWPLRELGNLYAKLGDYEKAKACLEQSLSIYQRNYGELHLTVAETLKDLGDAYLLQGKMEKSENLLRKALKILQQNDHTAVYSCAESLSDLFLKKSTCAMSRGEILLSKSLRGQSIVFLKQALNIAQARFPHDSPHITRISIKIKKIDAQAR